MHRNEHEFDIKLGLDGNGPDNHIKMDGKELKGVSSLIMKAGVDGYTNVVMQFDAPMIANVVAELTVNLDIEDETVEQWFATALDKALVKMESREGEGVDFPIKHRYCRALLTKYLLEAVIEADPLHPSKKAPISSQPK